MAKNKWIGDRGEDIQRDRLSIWNAGFGGRVIDRRHENVGYDFEVERYNIYTHKWETERHEVKTKGNKSRSYPSLTPNEKRAKEKYGDEYFVDNVDLPTYEEWFYDEFIG